MAYAVRSMSVLRKNRVQNERKVGGAAVRPHLAEEQPAKALRVDDEADLLLDGTVAQDTAAEVLVREIDLHGTRGRADELGSIQKAGAQKPDKKLD